MSGIHHRAHTECIFLYAFDLIELNGDHLRRDPLEGRKEMILAKAGAGIRFNKHMESDGETVFRQRVQTRGRRLSCRNGRIFPTALAARPIGAR